MIFPSTIPMKLAWFHFILSVIFPFSIPMIYMGLSINAGTPTAGWFIRESPSIHGWFWGTPIYGKPPYPSKFLYHKPHQTWNVGDHPARSFRWRKLPRRPAVFPALGWPWLHEEPGMKTLGKPLENGVFFSGFHRDFMWFFSGWYGTSWNSLYGLLRGFHATKISQPLGFIGGNVEHNLMRLPSDKLT